MANYHKILETLYPNLEWIGGDDTDYASLVYVAGLPSAIPPQADLDGYASYIINDTNLSEEDIYIARNETGADIPALTPVTIIGDDAIANQPLIAIALAADITSMPALGITKDIIPNNTTGIIITGRYQAIDVNTSSYNRNSNLYVAQTGGLTESAPKGAGTYQQVVGQVIKKSATNGRILFNIEKTFLDAAMIIDGTFNAHNSSMIQTVSSTPAIILFNNITVTSAQFYNYSNGNITILQDGNYMIHYDVSLRATSNHRSSSETYLAINGLPKVGTYSYGYHRMKSSGENTSSATMVIPLLANDVINIKSKRKVGGNLITLKDACRINIYKI